MGPGNKKSGLSKKVFSGSGMSSGHSPSSAENDPNYGPPTTSDDHTFGPSAAKNGHNQSPSRSKDDFTYSSSGVDLDEAARAVKLIKKPVFSTFSSNVLNDLTSFAGLFRFDSSKYREPVLVSSTDGVGTKLLIARQTGLYDHIGQDLVGMCINDILCCGATPLFFLDYIACGKLVPERINTIVSSIASGCIECEASLIGGETAEMPGMYDTEDIDLAGFAVGVVDKKDIINPTLVKKGDIVFGIPSSGLHSNGFSLVRKIIRDKNIDLKKDFVPGTVKNKASGTGIKMASGTGMVKNNKTRNLGEVILEPTNLYFKTLKKIKEAGIRPSGIAHITGGGFFENINRVIPKDMDAVISNGTWPVPEIFGFLQKMGSVGTEEMFRVFNMGIGMVILVSGKNAEKLKGISKKLPFKIFEIGVIKEGNGRVLIN